MDTKSFSNKTMGDNAIPKVRKPELSFLYATRHYSSYSAGKKFYADAPNPLPYVGGGGGGGGGGVGGGGGGGEGGGDIKMS